MVSAVCCLEQVLSWRFVVLHKQVFVIIFWVDLCSILKFELRSVAISQQLLLTTNYQALKYHTVANTDIYEQSTWGLGCSKMWQYWGGGGEGEY